MRLLRTRPEPRRQGKLEIVQVSGQTVPAYAILSHRWSSNADEEVVLSDVQNGTATTKLGFQKLENALNQAWSDGGWEYLWSDTCCIDKTSSVELSEAINSMYSYYENAQKCYAYLEDVRTVEDFTQSTWWDRGWTLQELLAPKVVEFFNKNWMSLGTKMNLHAEITQKTGIETEYLIGSSQIQYASVAKRMSWAAARETTRAEDMAYCLIGIFNVNMSMLYGEGARKAFLRLQEEIMKSNEDQSLFAWIACASKTENDTFHGLLADKPSDFRFAKSIIPYGNSTDMTPTTMTPRGLHISLPLIHKRDGTTIAALQCPAPGANYDSWLAVYLKKLPGISKQYARIKCTKLASIPELGPVEEIYVRQDFSTYNARAIYPEHFFHITKLTASSQDSTSEKEIYTLMEAIYTCPGGQASHFATYKPTRWSMAPLVYWIPKADNTLVAAIRVRRFKDREEFILMLGSRTKFEVGFDVSDENVNTSSVEELKAKFSPQPAGTMMRLRLHTVCVNVVEVISRNQKLYELALIIEARLDPQVHPHGGQWPVVHVAPELDRTGVKGKFKRFWTRK